MANKVENLDLAQPNGLVLKRFVDENHFNPDGRASVHSLDGLVQLLNFYFRHDLGSGER